MRLIYHVCSFLETISLFFCSVRSSVHHEMSWVMRQEISEVMYIKKCNRFFDKNVSIFFAFTNVFCVYVCSSFF